MIKRLALCAAAGLLAAGPAFGATELVANGGFETGDLTGWSAGYTAGANTCCYGFANGTQAAASASAFGSAISGGFSAFGDWDGGTSNQYDKATDFYVRQQLTKTSDVTSATLTFSFNLAGGAYASYVGQYQGYAEVLKRNVTANFLAGDLSTSTNLYTFERDIMTGNELFVLGVQHVTLDVTTAFNAMADGSFFLDMSRHVPQYFTGGGYFVMDNVSLKIGDAVVTPPGGVPEPGAWALMILGFAGAGAALRNQRRAVA